MGRSRAIIITVFMFIRNVSGRQIFDQVLLLVHSTVLLFVGYFIVACCRIGLLLLYELAGLAVWLLRLSTVEIAATW